MFNKVGFITIGVLLVLSGIGLLIKLQAPDNMLAQNYALQPILVAKFIGIFLLIYNGTIIKTRYFRIIQIGAAILIIGALFKIMHWFGGDELLLIASAGISVTYFLRFLAKDKKGFLDILKVLWVITACLGSVLTVLRWIPRATVYISDAIFWVMILYLVIEEFKKKRKKTV